MTTEGTVEVWAQTLTSLNRVILASNSLETLKSVTASIELAGTSEDEKDVGTFDQYLHPRPNLWTLELDRTTFKLWLCFEIDGYLQYGKNEFEDAVISEDHRNFVEETRSKMYGSS